MRRLLSWGLTAVMLFTVVGCSASAKTVPPDNGKSMTIREGIKKVNFKVRQPSWFPFTPSNTFAFAGTDAMGHRPHIELNYTDGNRYITLTEWNDGSAKVTDAPSEFPTTEVKLGYGVSAKLTDNGAAKILTWSSGGIFYVLGAGGKEKKDGAFTPEELAKIASSLK